MSHAIRMRIANDVLASKAAFQVDFVCGTCVINPQTMAKVRYALFSGAIDADVKPLPAGAEAAYSSTYNIYKIPYASYGVTPMQKASLFHESVHALGDIEVAWWRTDTEGEAAAYIAGMLYYQFSTGKSYMSAFPLAPSPFGIADSIAQKIKYAKSANINSSQLLALRQAIASNPIYQNVGVTLSSLSGDDGVW